MSNFKMKKFAHFMPLKEENPDERPTMPPPPPEQEKIQQSQQRRQQIDQNPQAKQAAQQIRDKLETINQALQQTRGMYAQNQFSQLNQHLASIEQEIQQVRQLSQQITQNESLDLSKIEKHISEAMACIYNGSFHSAREPFAHAEASIQEALRNAKHEG